MATRMYHDDAYGPNFLGHCLIEEEPRDIQFTGILTAEGRKICRLHPPKPKFGFPIFPEDNDGYDFDPEDFMYVETD